MKVLPTLLLGADLENEVWDYLGMREIIEQGYAPPLIVLLRQISVHPYKSTLRGISVQINRNSDEFATIHETRNPLIEPQLLTLIAEIVAYAVYKRTCTVDLFGDIFFYRSKGQRNIPAKLRYVFSLFL